MKNYKSIIWRGGEFNKRINIYYGKVTDVVEQLNKSLLVGMWNNNSEHRHPSLLISIKRIVVDAVCEHENRLIHRKFLIEQRVAADTNLILFWCLSNIRWKNNVGLGSFITLISISFRNIGCDLEIHFHSFFVIVVVLGKQALKKGVEDTKDRKERLVIIIIHHHTQITGRYFLLIGGFGKAGVVVTLALFSSGE